MSDTNTLSEKLDALRKRNEYRPTCDNWCNRCSRKHNSKDPCNQSLRERTAKSGRKVRRWAA